MEKHAQAFQNCMRSATKPCQNHGLSCKITNGTIRIPTSPRIMISQVKHSSKISVCDSGTDPHGSQFRSLRHGEGRFPQHYSTLIIPPSLGTTSHTSFFMMELYSTMASCYTCKANQAPLQSYNNFSQQLYQCYQDQTELVWTGPSDRFEFKTCLDQWPQPFFTGLVPNRPFFIESADLVLNQAVLYIVAKDPLNAFFSKKQWFMKMEAYYLTILPY